MHLPGSKNSTRLTAIGLGCPNYSIAVYIANTPPHQSYSSLNSLVPLSSGEIRAIGEDCGNGWRKVFNVYAKLLFQLNAIRPIATTSFAAWQDYRDRELLQLDSKTALIFSPPLQVSDTANKTVAHNTKSILHIICGKGYAQELISDGYLSTNLKWFDSEFAVDNRNNLFVCPYFDYRQLSNVKIERLIKLIRRLN